MSEPKAYKITDCARSKKYGVVVTSLVELINQARELFDIGAISEVKIVLESDGTVVQETYFLKLEEQTCFMVLKENEEWNSFLIDDDRLLPTWLVKRGNEEFNSKQYTKAIEFYNEAIDKNEVIGYLAEYATYYNDRAACYMSLNQYDKALEDCRISVTMNNKFVKGYISLIRSYLAVGEIAEAEKNLEIVLKLDTTNPSILTEQSELNKLKTAIFEAKLSYENKNYMETLSQLKEVIRVAKHCASFRIMKAECLILQKRFQVAQSVVAEILSTIDRENVDAMYIQGFCMYRMNKMKRAFANFQNVLKLAPNHARTIDTYLKAKLLTDAKEKGKEAFKAKKFKKAYDFYTDSLNIDPTNDCFNSKLYYKRAMVSFELGNFKDCVEDCSSSLNLDEKYFTAVLRRAKCYFILEQYDKAVLDYENAYSMKRRESTRILLDEAKSYLNTSTEKCCHGILGIQKDASFEEIKKAYHPDRHVNATEAKRKHEEIKFKAVGEAYAILSDKTKKRRYDQCQNSANSNRSNEANVPTDKNQDPAVLYFRGFPDHVHPNCVIQLIMQYAKFITSIHLAKRATFGLARFSNQESAKHALCNPLKIRYNKKEYSIVFSNKK